MINTILYYNPYILNSRIYSPGKFQRFRSAIITLIEPIYSNYKPMEAYNLDISLPLNHQSLGCIISCLIYIYSFTKIPLISMSIFKNPEPKQVFNQKNSGLYINNYIYNMQMAIVFTRKNKVFVAGVNYYI